MKIIKTEGIVLKKKDINEADVILTIFTESLGKIDCLINGIRKSKKREKVTINPMNISEITLYKKSNYYTIKEIELKKNFLEISKNINKIEIGLYFLDTINKVYEYNDVDKIFFNRIVDIFSYLDKIEIKNFDERDKIVVYFLKRIMIEQGIYEYNEIVTYFSEILREVYLLIESKSDFIESKNNEIVEIVLIMENIINKELHIKLDIKKFIMGERWNE